MTRVPKVFLAALFAAAGFSLAVAGQDPKTQPPEKQPPGKGEKGDAASLEGGYTITSGESDGKAIPADQIKGAIVKFTGDKIVGTDKDKKEFFAATYTLDTKAKPWTIKMKSTAPKEAEAVGLIKKDGNTVTVIYALPGGEAPKEFKTKEKQNLFVLENMNTKKKD